MRLKKITQQSSEIIDRSKSNLKVKKYRKQRKKKLELVSSRIQVDKSKLQNVNLIFGLDNGATGTICAIIPQYKYLDFIQTPSKVTLDYPKEITYINRVNINELTKFIKKNIKVAKKFYKQSIKIIVVMQRPMVNPQRFKQSGHALRAFEATIITLQNLEIDYIIIDSKKWQHYFFGKNTLILDLKFQSMRKGLEILNNYKLKVKEKKLMQNIIKKHGDADGMLICQFAIEKMIQTINKD